MAIIKKIELQRMILVPPELWEKRYETPSSSPVERILNSKEYIYNKWTRVHLHQNPYFKTEKIKREPIPVLIIESTCKSGPSINPLKPELNPICYLLALLGAHHFLHVSRIRVKLLTFRRLMSYTYGATILDVFRSHTTTQHSR